MFHILQTNHKEGRFFLLKSHIYLYKKLPSQIKIVQPQIHTVARGKFCSMGWYCLKWHNVFIQFHKPQQDLSKRT
jgi:hypothetical protein